MANYTFNGTTEIITPTDAPVGGAISIDVQDLYSRWVDWLLTSDNSKYQQAMRVVGGDPLPGSKQLGLTYFLMNGWKIKPYEANHIFTLNGNIYSEDGSSPFAPTAGAYNVTIISSVSNLVDSTVQQLPEIEHASFNDEVTINVDTGVAGTTYPIGTPTNPVNNLADAKAIAVYRGFKKLHLTSNLTVTTGQNIDEYTIKSDNWLEVTIQSGVSLVNTVFQRVSLYGVMGGYWNVLIDCWAFDLTNFTGWMRGGSFASIALAPYTVESLGQSYFDNLVPLYPNTPSILYMNDDVAVSFTESTDYTEIHDMTDGSILSMGLSGGKTVLDASCTGGDVSVYGVGEFENYDSPIVPYIDGLVYPRTVSDGVWDELTAGHQTTGTMGKALTSAGSAGDPWATDPSTFTPGTAGALLQDTNNQAALAAALSA